MSHRKKFILVPTGSAGDIHPFVWLGKGLVARGHDVCAIVHRPFDDLMRTAGIRPVAYGTKSEYEAVIRNPDLWHPRKGFELIARMSSRLYREIVPRVREEMTRGRPLLVGAGIAFGARIAAEAFNLPLVTIQLQPAAFMSVENPPVLRAGTEWFIRLPRWVRRLFYKFGCYQTDRLLAGGINAYRAELGLPCPLRGIMCDYWISPLRVIALFPDWFGPKQPDWPPQTVVTRFPLYDESDREAVADELRRFLDDSDPPVLFTPGSANVQAEGFFRTALEACSRLGCRGLFLTPNSEQAPPDLPPSVRHFAYVPFSQVFSRCAAVVHHGGIGTVAQGLAAGVPQLVMAMSHDQPDNGNRLRRMGVGDYLYPGAFRPSVVAEKIQRLITSPAVRTACQEYRLRMEKQMPAEDVFRLVDETYPCQEDPR
ncbi:MAG TPA: nucleotide disphospho-sugar-binding domain-containing protein [archaeon]|nr:nucleotide disphospho-sugar-binding domain-containing protein [archaeon]